MARFFRRRKFCRFTAEGTKEIDYKDLETLKAYVSEDSPPTEKTTTSTTTRRSWTSVSPASRRSTFRTKRSWRAWDTS